MWSEERASIASKLWADGQTASEIAAKLGEGFTRCSVIGKLHRMGQPKGSQPAFSSTEEKLRKLTTIWSEEAIKQLRKFWSEGRSLVFMENHFKVSKTAINNLVNRLNLPIRIAGHSFNSGIKVLPKNFYTPTPMPRLEKCEPVGLMQRTGCACPVGKKVGEHQLFCNAPLQEGKTYCDFHHQKMRRDADHPYSVRRAARIGGVR